MFPHCETITQCCAFSRLRNGYMRLGRPEYQFEAIPIIGEIVRRYSISPKISATSHPPDNSKNQIQKGATGALPACDTTRPPVHVQETRAQSLATDAAHLSAAAYGNMLIASIALVWTNTFAGPRAHDARMGLSYRCCACWVSHFTGPCSRG
jgi:hypothetical protein